MGQFTTVFDLKKNRCSVHLIRVSKSNHTVDIMHRIEVQHATTSIGFVQHIVYGARRKQLHYVRATERADAATAAVSPPPCGTAATRACPRPAHRRRVQGAYYYKHMLQKLNCSLYVCTARHAQQRLILFLLHTLCGGGMAAQNPARATHCGARCCARSVRDNFFNLISV